MTPTTTVEREKKTASDALGEALALWKRTVEAELKGAPFEKKLVTRTFEGLSLQPLYTRLDVERRKIAESVPAAAPFTRGFRDKTGTVAGWEYAQDIAATDCAEFGARLKKALAGGQNAVVVRLNRECRWAAESGATATDGGGEEGLRLRTAADLALALDGADLSRLPLHLETGATALPAAALLLAHARKSRVEWKSLSGSCTADPLGEWALRGRVPVSLDHLMDDLAQWTIWAERHAPRLSTVGVSSALWHEAGANAAQEIAFALSCGVEYIRALCRRGITASAIATRLRFTFGVGPQFFTEVAKQRAFRACWARVLGAFNVDPSRSAPKVHARTSGWNFSRLDPNVNLLRATTEALSAVLGGVDSLHIGSVEGPEGACSETAERISRNIHLLLAEEFRLTAPQDAAGGSFYVESITDDLAREAWRLFQQVEGHGGYAVCLRRGDLQRQVRKAADEKQNAVNQRRAALVGVNLYPNLKEKPPLAAPVAAAKATARNGAGEKRTLPLPNLNIDQHGWLETAANAAADGATLAQLMRFAHRNGDPLDNIEAVRPTRAAASFEALRTAAANYAQRKGAAPKVFLARMGPPLQHKARADFSAGFFATGGFESVGKESFAEAEAAAAAAVQSGAPVVVLCSTDDTYPALAPAFAKAVKSAAPSVSVVLAGAPAEHLDAFRAAGFDEFIHLRADVHDTLARLLSKIGATA